MLHQIGKMKSNILIFTFNGSSGIFFNQICFAVSILALKRSTVIPFFIQFCLQNHLYIFLRMSSERVQKLQYLSPQFLTQYIPFFVAFQHMPFCNSITKSDSRFAQFFPMPRLLCNNFLQSKHAIFLCAAEAQSRFALTKKNIQKLYGVTPLVAEIICKIVNSQWDFSLKHAGKQLKQTCVQQKLLQIQIF